MSPIQEQRVGYCVLRRHSHKNKTLKHAECSLEDKSIFNANMGDVKIAIVCARRRVLGSRTESCRKGSYLVTLELQKLAAQGPIVLTFLAR